MKNKILNKKSGILIVLTLFFLLFLNLSSAQTSDYVSNQFSSSGQYYQQSYQSFYSQQGVNYKSFWPSLDSSENCEARQDFIVNIRPGGCEPMVIRSDLLEEQNVPVFCKLDAIKLNPLIDVASIDSVRFKGDYPQEIAGISFHPSKAALNIYNPVLDSPIMNDIGYIVIALKQIPAERDMPDFVNVNLTAILEYNMENSFGAGQSVYYLPELEQNEWEQEYESYSFWKGKGFLKADYIEQDRAGISIYSDSNNIIKKIVLKEGQTSPQVYMPGFYCAAGVKVKLSDIEIGKTRARIQIGENSEWLTEGQRFYDNKCRVIDITGLGGGAGTVSLKCQREEVILRIGVTNKIILGNNEFELGEKISDGENGDDIYLVYIGKQDLNSEQDLFIITASDINNALIEDDKIKQEWLDNIARDFGKWKFESEQEDEGWKEGVKEKIKNVLGANQVGIIEQNEDVVGEEFIGTAGPRDKDCKDVFSKSNCENLYSEFENAENTVSELIKKYGSEKKPEGDYYGAESLYQLSELAGKIGKEKTQADLLNQIVDDYPSSSFSTLASSKLEQLNFYDYENSGSLINIDNLAEYFKLLSVEKPGYDEASAFFQVTNKSGLTNVLIDEYIISKQEDIYAKLVGLNDNSVLIEFTSYIDDKYKKFTEELRKGKTLVINKKDGEKVSIELTKVNVKRLAEIKLISKIPDTTSEANFSVKIGIEKRGIQLTPEKTAERIQNLNKSIEKWEQTTEKLGKLVKGWKGACFATSTALIVKNLFSNMGGRTQARQIAMNNYWKDYCSKQEGMSRDECYMIHNDEIEDSVDKIAEQIENTNKEMEDIIETQSQGFLSDIFEGKKAVNLDESKEKMSAKLSEFVQENPDLKINVKGEEKSLSEIFGTDLEIITSNIDNSGLSINQMRDIITYGNVYSQDSEHLQGISKNSLSKKLDIAYEEIEKSKQFGDIGNIISEKYQVPLTHPEVKGNRHVTNTINVENGDIDNVENGEYFFFPVPQTINSDYAGKLLLVKAKGQGNNLGYDTFESSSGEEEEESYVGHIIEQDGNNLIQNQKISESDFLNIINNEKINIGSFIEINKDFCENKYTNPEVKFYETEPDKGMPAVVPVDTEKGWYAATEQTLGAFSQQKSFQSSGAVTSLWLCNVGQDGREEWQTPINDDEPCIQINYNTGQPLNQLTCLSENEARQMARKAKSILEDAASQYQRGIKGGQINLASGRFPIETASPSSGTECQDFMSPQDCTTLFNVCDPVLCPSSRCDLGGSYPVDNVIQSGIIGSIFLCLPNFGNPSEGGVVVPVCLTGIHAGLDAFTSILKAHRDCLQENLETGRHVGICDEIYSVYLCEFFWRQTAPIMDIALPKLIEYAYTGGQTQARGGGEYLTFQSAWDNMQQSVRYFTDSYGINTFQAFRAGSTGEMGSEVCKAFISTSFPTSSEAFDKLLEPESPVQFYARFDEVPYSDATVPATSQYKVYYHIFAGREKGSYYQIYLSSPPTTGYYSQQPYIVIDSGYAGVGQTVDITKDITAPEGYKELCVKIDNQEKCGFKQVTTSFAMNYLKDKYLEEQATDENIDSSEECVSGTPSLYPAVSPSLQGGAEEAVQPKIYKRGLIRVCSSHNPGNATTPDRWKAVGYCDEDKGIKCWLDSTSVEDSIKDLNLTQQTLSKAQEQMNKLQETGTMTEQETVVELDNAGELLSQFKNNKNVFSKSKVLEKLELIIKNGFFNHQKAKAVFMKFSVYKILTELELKSIEQKEKTTPEVEKPEESEDYEKSDEKKALEAVEAVEKAESGEISREWKWTRDSDREHYILDKINELIEKYGGNAKYSANNEIKTFVNQLNEDEIISEKEFIEITGEGFFNFNLQENLKYVQELILEKIAEYRRSNSQLDVEKESEDEEEKPESKEAETTEEENLKFKDIDCTIQNIAFEFDSGIPLHAHSYFKFEAGAWKYGSGYKDEPEKRPYYNLDSTEKVKHDEDEEFISRYLQSVRFDKIKGFNLLVDRTLNEINVGDDKGDTYLLREDLKAKLDYNKKIVASEESINSWFNKETYIFVNNRWQISGNLVSKDHILYNKDFYEGSCLIFSRQAK